MKHNIPIPLLRRALAEVCIRLNDSDNIGSRASSFARARGTYKPEVIKATSDKCLQVKRCEEMDFLKSELDMIFRTYLKPIEMEFSVKEYTNIVERSRKEVIDRATRYATITGDGSDGILDVLDI
jgi:hypothetical protein